jgi:hypothetical protein
MRPLTRYEVLRIEQPRGLQDPATRVLMVAFCAGWFMKVWPKHF